MGLRGTHPTTIPTLFCSQLLFQALHPIAGLLLLWLFSVMSHKPWQIGYSVQVYLKNNKLLWLVWFIEVDNKQNYCQLSLYHCTARPTNVFHTRLALPQFPSKYLLKWLEKTNKQKQKHSQGNLKISSPTRWGFNFPYLKADSFIAPENALAL